MRWFRWYAGTAEDIKIHAVANNADVTAATVTGVWAALLEDASNDDHPGVVSKSRELLGIITMLADTELDKIFASMEKYGMLKLGERIQIVNWNKRQFRSDRDPTNNERQARYRQKHNALGNDQNQRQRQNQKEDDSAQFDQFWSAYPRKESKGQARKAFKAALKKTDLPTLLAALGSIDRSDPKFIPHASSWLNGERWLDEKPKANGTAAPAMNDADLWRYRLKSFKKTGFWPPNIGAPPTDPYCDCPPAILTEFGLSP